MTKRPVISALMTSGMGSRIAGYCLRGAHTTFWLPQAERKPATLCLLSN